jgi:glycosyltransferase involved in cell wall biosynthesis
MARRTVRAVRHAVVLNERVQQEVQEILPDGVGVSTIDNGVDLDRFRPAAGDERAALRAQLGFTRPVVLSVARHVAKKQLPLLLEAARGDVPYDLVLCGKGTAVLHDPANHVWGLGPVTADRVADLYRCADVLVLVSHSEGFPLVVQEAAASGLPMVLTDLPMYRHRFGEGGACLVGPTPEAIRGALRYLIDDPAARASMGAAARAVAQRRWSWEHTLDQYDQLYDDVISAGRRPRVPL